MSTRIQYTTTTAMGELIAEFTRDLLKVRLDGLRLKSILDSMSYGTPSTFERIELEVGGMVEGEGEAMYNLITGAVSSIDVANVTNLSRIDQG